MDDLPQRPPATLDALLRRTRALGFDAACEARTGSLLRVLAASKPGGRLLELGTGTGVGTAWLLDGMDSAASLISVDTDARVQAVARAHLGADARLTLVQADALAFVAAQAPGSFDLVFADAWPGKFEGLDAALALLRRGGFYVVDDLLPQPNWPAGDHASRVRLLLATLSAQAQTRMTTLAWASGLAVLVRTTSSRASRRPHSS
ncbi:MAG: class I SAM-dependent methyltransferase [Acetobacteraceae bacterium]|nr:class I SAM-dependent methyltransferase [Acetobacteraceae bacterium]MBV8616194.1 class I SAM-dependent methyltransferase [Acetobacteraceae bacterium]